MLKTWVTNIQSVEKILHLDFGLYEIVCDMKRNEIVAKDVKLLVNGYDYKMIRENGYYLF